jgi:hypothetical protein
MVQPFQLTEDDAVRVLELALEVVVVRVAEIEEEFPAGLLDPFLLLLGSILSTQPNSKSNHTL